MAQYTEGTKLKDARNNQIYPYTKAEYVEGLEDYLSGAVTAPEDTEVNSVPITTEDGSVDWVELQAGTVAVKIDSDVFTSGSLEEVLLTISDEIKKLQDAVKDGVPGSGATGGFIPVLVSELPEEGEKGVIYRVPIKGVTTSTNKYDEFYWTGDRFEKFGDREPGGADWNGDKTETTFEWEDD